MKNKTSSRKKTTKKQFKNGPVFKDFKVITLLAVFLSVILVFWAVYIVKAEENEPIVYLQEFEHSPIDEADPSGQTKYNYDWYLFNPVDGETAVKQVASGSGGIVASSGDYYGVISKELSYSKFGECIPDGPSDRWLTQLDVYLDTNWELGRGFNYYIETMSHTPDNNDILKYSVFHVTKDKSTKKLLIGASAENSNSTREDLETINNYTVKKSGWYTFRSKLRSVGTSLVIDMSVVDTSAKKVVWQNSLTSDDFSYDLASLSWNCQAGFSAIYNGHTVNNPDLPPEDKGFDLPIDNHKLVLYNYLDLTGPPENKEECFNDGWKIFDWETFSEPTFKNQGECVSYTEEN